MKSVQYRAAASAAAIISASLSAYAGGTTSWLSPVDGDWNIGANWDTGLVPTLTDSVLLGHASAYTVTVPTSNSMASLTISNPNAVLSTNNATSQTILGDLLNNGTVVVNTTANVSTTSLSFNANSMLSGTGSILLNAPSSRAQIVTGGGFTFTQGSGHTIHGQGRITGAMVNDGLVSSDAGATMVLNTSNKTNNNIMEAINSSTLDLRAIGISQGLAGVIRADGAGSQVTLLSLSLTGGSLETTAGGLISVIGSSTLDSVTLNGSLDVQNAVTLTINNAFTNDGTLTVNPTGNVSATQISFNNTMTVGGSGEFVLASSDARARILTANGQTVTMNPKLTIRGEGRIEADMVNNGLISSDTAEIRLTTNNKVNNGTMEAINGAVLELNGVGVTQSAGGLIEADGVGSQIELLGSSITGGTLRSVNGADISVDSSSTLDGVSFAGDLDIQNAQTLTVNSSLINNGTIAVNPTGNVSATQIIFNDSMSVGGTGEILLSSLDSRARILTGTGAVVTMPATQSIRGFGRIEADMVNNGLIRADAGEIRLTTNDKVNNNTIEAVNASTIEVNSITIDQSGGGTLSANDAGSQIELLGATIIGGQVSSAPGADITIDNTSTLDGVSLSGTTNIPNAQTLTIGTSLTNNGVIEVNPTGNVSATQILFIDTMTVMGTGSIKLSSFDSRARILTAAGQTVRMSPTQTIHGQGRIEASMINDGLIDSDVVGGEIRFTTNDKTNNGMIQANNESNLEFNGINVTQSPSGQISATGAGSEIELLGATISGGSLSATGGADVSIDSISTLEGVDFSGLLNIPNASTLGIGLGTLNNGLIVVNETANVSTTQLQWNEEMTLGGTGTIRLNAPSARSRLIPAAGVSQGGLGVDQRLEGIGRISLNLTNHGTTAPGLSIGTMFATQPITFTDTSVFEAEVDGTTADLLDSTSTITIDGTLEVVFTDGFAPTGYWARKIMEGSSISGKFDAIIIPTPPAGFVTRVYNDGANLFVGQTCPSDTNLDGALNFFDVSVFLNNYNAGSAAADLNGDGVLNFFDVSVFLNSYNMGC